MSGNHWSASYCEWIRNVVSEWNGVPIYLRRSSEMPEWLRVGRSIAWSACYADLQMRDILIQRDEWQGRGVFIGVNPSWDAMPLQEQRAILLHEASHSLGDFDAFMSRPESEFGDIERTLLQPGGAAKLVEEWNLKPLDDATSERLAHGLRFVRCCLHLWARTWEEISLADMRVFSDRYVLTDDSMTDAVRALRPELWHGGHLIDILKSTPPAVFAALFAKKPANSEAKST